MLNNLTSRFSSLNYFKKNILKYNYSKIKNGPIDGIRVLDFTRILAGPFATKGLGDYGAEIIKIERPGLGDDTRSWGPPFVEGGESTYFLGLNRNKKSLTVDLKSKEGTEIIKKLVKISDVVVDNFIPGTLEKLGLDYEVFNEINPRIIHCSITGFGPTGPYANNAAYDVMISAIGGLMDITGNPDGEPCKVGVALTDVITGLSAQSAINAALYAREYTGVGQRIETSLLENQVASLVNVASNYINAGVIGKRWGSSHPSIVPYQAFKARDGYIVLGANNDTQWERLCKVIKFKKDLTNVDKYKTNALRVKHRKEVISILSDIFIERDVDFWVKELNKEKIGCTPINDTKKVFEDPQVLHRDMLVEIPGHETFKDLKNTGIPVKFSHTKASIKLPPPTLSSHTDEILINYLGYSKSKIEELRKEKII
eukprot:TRINITY_DN8649_c0_g1_i1.p1 TRINITY_DN8649_c0_g1~~TRINITY_DN8649_c0_g1_i1.p1  ORF type:complete len:427 (-),score=109.14 TRINITY_DN8649_c0_g1_i1:24-1304(-)